MPIQDSTALLGTLIPEWEALLQGWSLDGSLAAAAQEALLLNGTPQALLDLIAQRALGDSGSLPPIVLLSSAEISGAMGAYAINHKCPTATSSGLNRQLLIMKCDADGCADTLFGKAIGYWISA